MAVFSMFPIESTYFPSLHLQPHPNTAPVMIFTIRISQTQHFSSHFLDLQYKTTPNPKKPTKMQKANTLTAKDFIKGFIQRQNYECMICYQVCIKPVRCRGSCKKIFCMKCVSDTRLNSEDKCPNRCSQPFLVDQLPELNLEFYCPYNPSQCQVSIFSVKQFLNHYKNCRFVSPQVLNYKLLVHEYKCLKGHSLEFYVGSYEQMNHLECKQCKEDKLCRSMCRICQEFYCVTCRIPPCCKEECPIGHKFTFQRTQNINFICDICGISTAVSNGGVFDDNLCNFGICQPCFQQLPDKYDESKPRSIVANINTACSCGNKLALVNAMGHLEVCELCKRERQCGKKCLSCGKNYCISCKYFDVYSDMTCLEDHSLIKIERNQPNSNEEQIMMAQEPSTCMRCGKEPEQEQQLFMDPECFVRLCEPCLQYSMKVTTDKQRPINLFCDIKHPLIYCQDEENLGQDFFQYCSKCKKQKVIQWACPICVDGQNMTLFCFQCKPIPLQTCYFQHKLKNIQMDHERQCQFCRKITNQFMHCAKCSFFVCHPCVSKTLQQPLQMEIEEKSEGMAVE